jgi:hypothetical protein
MHTDNFRKTIQESFALGLEQGSMREGDGVPVKVTQKAAGATPQSVAELISKMNPDVFQQFIGSLKKTGLEILFGDNLPQTVPNGQNADPTATPAAPTQPQAPVSAPTMAPNQDLKDL